MSVLKVIWGIRWEQSEPAHLSTFELSLLSEGREVERHYLLGQDGQFPPETEGELSYRFSLPMPEAVIRLKVVVEGEGGSLTGQLEDSSAKAASVAGESFPCSLSFSAECSILQRPSTLDTAMSVSTSLENGGRFGRAPRSCALGFPISRTFSIRASLRAGW